MKGYIVMSNILHEMNCCVELLSSIFGANRDDVSFKFKRFVPHKSKSDEKFYMVIIAVKGFVKNEYEYGVVKSNNIKFSGKSEQGYCNAIINLQGILINIAQDKTKALKKALEFSGELCE
jgi:hypothetical protein